MILLIGKFYPDERMPALPTAKLTYTWLGNRTAIIHTVVPTKKKKP